MHRRRSPGHCQPVERQREAARGRGSAVGARSRLARNPSNLPKGGRVDGDGRAAPSAIPRSARGVRGARTRNGVARRQAGGRLHRRHDGLALQQRLSLLASLLGLFGASQARKLNGRALLLDVAQHARVAHDRGAALVQPVQDLGRRASRVAVLLHEPALL